MGQANAQSKVALGDDHALRIMAQPCTALTSTIGELVVDLCAKTRHVFITRRQIDAQRLPCRESEPENSDATLIMSGLLHGKQQAEESPRSSLRQQRGKAANYLQLLASDLMVPS